MAENESLDLGNNRHSSRWDEIYTGIRDGTAWEKIARKVSKKLHDALRKFFKQLAKKGVLFEQLLAARESPGAINELVKKSCNQPFAVLFRDVCLSESTKDTEGVLKAFVWAAWETISDRIEHRLASPSAGHSLLDLHIAFNEVNHLIESDVNRLCQKLAKDPTQVPARIGKKGSKVDPTTEMMNMSLLGTNPQ
ncbi:MAG: hypothetical protein HY040_23635 [Planctomycetes bacterium]|nr:hypothetical protein [Planctomycetota bacterium]